VLAGGAGFVSEAIFRGGTMNDKKKEEPQTSTEPLQLKIKRVRVHQQTNVQTGYKPIKKP
jgi:hypothetical protein